MVDWTGIATTQEEYSLRVKMLVAASIIQQDNVLVLTKNQTPGEQRFVFK